MSGYGRNWGPRRSWRRWSTWGRFPIIMINPWRRRWW